MNHKNRYPMLAIAVALSLAPASLSPASASVEGGHATSDLRLPLQGIVSNAGCASIAVNGTVHLLVQARVEPDPGFVLAQVILNGAVEGTTRGGTPYVGIIVPGQMTLQCHPPDPCALGPISFQLDLFAIGPSAFEPPDPCDRQEVTGTLNLTLNPDGTVLAATLTLGGVT